MSKLLVLHVEDDVNDAVLIQDSMVLKSGSDFKINNVTCLQDALDHLMVEGYDVVLLDLGLMDAYGTNSIEQIRSINKDVPIVVFSGSMDHEIKSKVEAAGANAFMAKKEFSATKLHDIIMIAAKTPA